MAMHTTKSTNPTNLRVILSSLFDHGTVGGADLFLAVYEEKDEQR